MTKFFSDQFEYDASGIAIICQGIVMVITGGLVVAGSQTENRKLLMPFLATEIYGLSSFLNAFLILTEFRNNSTAYTDNPWAVLFGVMILCFMCECFLYFWGPRESGK